MSKDIYFSILFKDIADGQQHGMAVHIPQDPQQSPSDQIKGLNTAARKFAETNGIRVRTEMLTAPTSGIDLRHIREYLWGTGDLNADRLIRHLEDYLKGRKPHRFQPKVGMTVVMEEEFIGRKQTLQRLETLVADSQSCHLRAPRRYGKSSLMGRLVAKLERAVMLELSDVGTLQGFLKMLLRACMRHELARPALQNLAEFKGWPDSTDLVNLPQVFNEEFSELTEHYKGRGLEELVHRVLTCLADNGAILMIDEFSIFLRNMHERNTVELKQFLQSFYQLRTRPENPLISVFAGSAGLSTFIELFDMHDQFADLTQVDVLPVTSAEARLLAEELFYGMEKLPTVATIEHLVKMTGNDETVPYFVQALASYAAEQAGQKLEVSKADVEQAYYDRLLGPQGNICFRDFTLRERAYPGDYRKCASPILNQLSQVAPSTVNEQELQGFCVGECDFNKLMTCLEEDYDLVYENNGWRMRSRVIADRWRLGESWLTVGEN